MGAAFGAFFYNVYDAQGGSYLLYALSGAPKQAFAGFGLPRATPLFAHTFEGRGVVRLDDVRQDPRYGKLAPHHGMPAGHLPVVSYLAVPVISAGGTVIGGLFYGHPQPGRFTEQHARMIKAVAASAAVAIDNARLYQETRRRAEQMLLVNEVGRSLVASLELDQVLDAGVRNLARIVDCPDAYLLLPNAAGTDLVLRAVAGYGRQYLGVTCPAAPPEHNL